MNLDGWVFDDDDDGLIAQASISAANGNTIVPASSVAVLYPGDELDFMPQRFNDAWGGGVNLIPVNGFTSLTATDSIGLWPSHAAYMADAIPMATASPRRTFASAATALDYSSGFPVAVSGRSIAWNGIGGVANGANWVESDAGELGAIESTQTFIDSAAINSTLDTGNPGVLPAGARSAGLHITEIMFDPRSPAVTTGYSEADFEWVEVLNNTASPINFAATNYVFDDFVGELDAPNITEGSLAVGEVGVLFNSARILAADMETMWGEGIKFIPVSDWPALNNDTDTIAIWDSQADYDNELIDVDDHRGRQFAAASVQYNTLAGEDWPTANGESSIFRNDLTASPDAGENWIRSGSDDDDLGSSQPEAIFQTATDHPGGDVGSPGHVPGTIIVDPLFGDYNNDGRVNAADYTVWRDRLGSTTAMPNDLTPGSVTPADYDVWKASFGNLAGSGGMVNDVVPEPATSALIVVAVVGMLTHLRRVSRPRSL